MKITIDVTQDDINKGIKENCRFCPVALAVQRTFNDPEMDVFSPCIKNCEEDRVASPSSVCDFIDRYDNGESVQPFSFEIDVPETWVKK